MTLISIGDLSQSLALRGRAGDLKARIARLTAELSSGQTRDIAGRTGGDYGYLTDIDRNLARLDSFALAAAEATLFSEAAQLSLGRVQAITDDLGAALLSVTAGSLPEVLSTVSAGAVQDLDQVVAALNTTAGGRSVFAGTATGRPALTSAADLMQNLRSELTGLSTSEDILAAMDAWFEDPGGFRSAVYGGATQNLAPIPVGEDDFVEVSFRADDPVLRAAIRDVAVAAIASDPQLGFDQDTQHALMSAAGERLLGTTSGLVSLRSDLGKSEERLEGARVRNSVAQTSLMQARSALLEADPYETASMLEEAQSQLEALYAVTVRNSRLTLLSFLS